VGRVEPSDIEELEELLPLYIDYHRAAKWFPDPHRGKRRYRNPERPFAENSPADVV
jgi:hypothetical protein